MADTNVLRTLDSLQIRIKQLERALRVLDLPTKEYTSFPTRAGLDLGKINIAQEVLTTSPLLQNLYENPTLTRLSVGTWPQSINEYGACCVTGLSTTSEGEIIEHNRLTVYPCFLKAAVPFSVYQVDPGEELPKGNGIRKLLSAAASHLIQFTPAKANVDEVILVSRVGIFDCIYAHLIYAL